VKASSFLRISAVVHTCTYALFSSTVWATNTDGKDDDDESEIQQGVAEPACHEATWVLSYRRS